MRNHVRSHFRQVLLDSIKHLPTRYSDSHTSLAETPTYLCRKSKRVAFTFGAACAPATLPGSKGRV